MIRRWLAYRRRLAILLAIEEAAGHRIGPARYRQLQQAARAP